MTSNLIVLLQSSRLCPFIQPLIISFLRLNIFFSHASFDSVVSTAVMDFLRLITVYQPNFTKQMLMLSSNTFTSTMQQHSGTKIPLLDYILLFIYISSLIGGENIISRTFKVYCHQTQVKVTRG
jgi:hypothetical protein